MVESDIIKNKLLTSITTGNPIIDTLLSIIIVGSLSTLSFESFRLLFTWCTKKIKRKIESVATVECSYTLAKNNGWEADPHTKKNAKLVAALEYVISKLGLTSEDDKIKLDQVGSGCNIEANSTDKIIKIPVSRTKVPDYELDIELTVNTTETTNVSMFEIYHTNHVELDRFLNDTLRQYNEYLQTKYSDLGIYMIDSDHRNNNVSYYPLIKRDIGTVHFPNKEKILKLIKAYETGQSKINNMTVLLHGPPGGGKSSLIRAIATETDRSVLYVKLSEIGSLSEGIKTFHSEMYYLRASDSDIYLPSTKKIIVIEDIDADCLGKIKKREEESDDESINYYPEDENSDCSPKKRKKIKEETGPNLSDILNLFDGIFNRKGTFIIITTNHPEKLDPALLRPGRITINLELGACDKEVANGIVRNFFPDFAGFEDFKWTISPAGLENLCQTNDTTDDLVRALNGIIDDTIEKDEMFYDDIRERNKIRFAPKYLNNEVAAEPDEEFDMENSITNEEKSWSTGHNELVKWYEDNCKGGKKQGTFPDGSGYYIEDLIANEEDSDSDCSKDTHDQINEYLKNMANKDSNDGSGTEYGDVKDSFGGRGSTDRRN